MHAVNADTGFAFQVTTQMPGLSLGADHELTSIVKQLTGSNSTGKVSYGTEGGYYPNAGIATIVCGPAPIPPAHQPAGGIAQEQPDACDAFIRRPVDRVLV